MSTVVTGQEMSNADPSYGDKQSTSALIIDAHKSSRLIVQEELQAAGIVTTLAQSGDAGVAAALKSPPDLIVLDLALDGKDGIEVVNQLKVFPETRQVPVVVVTGFENKSETDRARRSGILGLLQKPFQPGTLTQMVEGHFNLGNSREVLASNILLVEDSETIRTITRYLLEKHGHSVLEAADGVIGWETLKKKGDKIDMVVTDINMPNMDGIELVKKIRSDSRFQFIPIVVSTTISDKANIKLLLNLGAEDYIVKPFSSEEFIARIGSHLRVKSLFHDLHVANRELATFNETLEQRVIERTTELREAHLAAIYSLAVAAEAKDDATGNHVYRIKSYSQALARELGLSEAVADEIGYSSIMHDVGKISIPDNILKKPAKLTNEEFDLMKTHCVHGERILPDQQFFATARMIARSHHEKWNGKGYPDGLAGSDIPLAARIVAVADVFDALVSNRCYKNAWPVERAFEEIEKSSGSHFDPDMVAGWVRLVDKGEVAKILKEWQQ